MTTVSPSEVVPNNDFSPEIKTEDAAGVREEISTKASEPVEKFYSRPQGYIHSVSDRPSVIQKLEKGQQHPLEFIHKVGSSMKEFNPVGLGHSTNNRQSVICSLAISNALVSCLPESSHERPVTADTTTGLSLGVPLDSVNKCDPNKVDKYLKQLVKGSRNPMLPSHPETSSVPYQKPEELNRKSLRINSDKLTLQENVNSQTKALSTGFKVHEFAGTENSLKLESLSKFAVSPVVNLNKTDMPSNKGIFEDDILKHHEKFFPNMDHNQEGKHLVFNKSAFSEQKISVSSEMKSAGGSLQSASDHCEEAEPALWKGEQTDQEDKNCESRDSEVGFDGSSSFYSLMDQSKGTAEEINLSKEVHTDLQYKNNTSYISEISSDCDDSLQLTTSRTQVKDGSVQKARHIRLVDESYESSDSEMNFDCDASLQSTDDSPQQPEKEVNLPTGALVGLVDMSYGSSSSEISADSVFSLQSMPGQLPVTVTETELRKDVHMSLVDKNYGSSCSETSFDGNVSLQSVFDHPDVAVSERNLEDRLVSLKDRNYKPSIKEVNAQEVAIDLENKSVKSGISDLSFESHPIGASGEINMKALNVDMEVKSYGCSSFESTFDSDSSFMSVSEYPELDVEEISKHVNLEDESFESISSEITFYSDSPLHSVIDQSQVTVYEEDPIDLENKSCESYVSEITFDSDVNFLKERVDLEDKVVKPSDSKINLVSDEPLQSVANEVQEAVTEMNLLRDGPVCLSAKSYEPNDSEIIFVSNTPLQSVVEPHHDLEEQQANLEDKSNDPCGPKINFVSECPLQSVTGPHQKKAVKEIGLWEEDHIYLEDKRYKLGDFEVSYDSNVDFVAGHSTVAVKEINLQEEDQNDLENKNCELSVSEIKCDSGVHLQLGVDQPHVVCKETNLQMEKHLDMQEEVSEPRDSEIMCDSDVPLQIVINELEESDRETDKMLFVDLTASDDDCEMISDSDVPFQPAIDSPQRTVKEISCINAESFDLDENCDSCDSELRYVCEASPQSVKTHSKKVFKVVKQKQDYIILEETSCEPYVSELSFQTDSSHQSVTYQSQESEKKKAKYSDSKDKSCQSSGPKRNFEWEETSQPVAQQQQKVDKGVNLWKDVENIGLKDKNCESGVSTMDFNASPGLVIHQMPDQENLLKLKHTDLESMICEPCGSWVNFQCDPSLQSGNDRPQEAVNKINLFKKMSFDQRETNHNNSHSDSVPMVDSIRDLEKAKEVIEDDLHELLPKDLSPVPPSFVGKMWSQIMKEDDVQMSALVKEFKKGHLYCYFVSDCEMRKIKKKILNEEKKMTWTDLNQDTTSFQVLSDCDDNVGGISDIDDFSVALDKPNHYPSTERNHEQTWREASQGQAIKVSHGTQTNLTSHPGTKRRISGQEKDSPVRKHLLLQNDGKSREKVKKNEFPESGDNDPYVQSSASVPFVAVSAGHELKTQEASESSVFPEKSRIFSSSEISKECNFQSTFSSRDVAKTSSKSFRKRFLKSKSKNQRRKVIANNKPDFPKKGCRSVIPQQNTRTASEKRSIWIQSKLSDIIKKYIPKYSVFLRHKYQCRSTSVRMHVKKKKPDVSRLKKVKKPANVLSNSSVLSAGAEEQSRAIASCSPKQPVQTSSSAARSKKNGNKKHPRRQQRKPYRPIRTYDLRSLFSGVSYSDRMRTRFSNKL
ncbi:hypothetical protein Celaphus_00015114, partial [Cervus elaphus hippelaphus]